MAEEQANPVQDEVEETMETDEKVKEIPLESPTMIEAVSAPKAKARGKRGPDKKPRAKPKPKARITRMEVAQNIIEESSESSADEATLQEIHSLNYNQETLIQ